MRCPSCRATMGYLDHGKCPDCKKYCGCSFSPTSNSDYCGSHRPGGKTFNEKLVDEGQQMAYRLKCSELAFYFYRGPRTGQIDNSLTDLLKQTFAYFPGTKDVDWIETHRIREAAVLGHRKEQEKQKQ